jgi:hypothetical protein
VLRVRLSLTLAVYVCDLPTGTRFGAVLEEFEVRDALESVFYTKPDMNGHSNSI